MKIRQIIFVLILLLLLYLFLFPVPIDPQAWTPPAAPPLEGDYAPNDLMSKIARLEGRCLHCEDVAIDSLGRLYGASENGEIIRFDPQGGTADVFADTDGRPLGLDFDSIGNLIVTDSYKGLLSIDSTGKITTLATEYGGRSFGFADDLEVAKDGTIYFSDASWKFPVANYTLDLLEHSPNGRLFAYNPATKKTSLLLDSLYFANGIAVSEDQSFVLVNETGMYRVTRYWLTGPKKGNHDTFIDNLPGFPDGISSGEEGIFWLTLISPRKPAMDAVMDKPFLRKILVRLPQSLQPKPERYGFILGLDQSGKTVYNMQDPTGGFAQISSVQQFGDNLYLGSLAEESIGVLPIPK